AARLQHAETLRQPLLFVDDVVQGGVEKDGVEAAVRQRALFERTAMKRYLRAVLDPVVLEEAVDAFVCEADHVLARLDTVDGVAKSEQNLRHPAGPAAHFENPAAERN